MESLVSPGRDGQDADIEEIKGIIKSEVSIEVREAVAELPPAEQGPPGEPGRDGADADMDVLSELIKTEVHTKVHDAVAALPPADPGPPGEPGKDADPAIIASMVREQVSAVVAAFEPDKGSSRLVRKEILVSQESLA
jgi:hypothetical protein